MKQPTQGGQVAASETARQAEFEALFKRYYGPLIGFFLNRGFDRADCEDLAQDTLMSAYRCYDTFRGEASDATWLFVIAANKWRNHLRSVGTRKRKGENVSLDGPRLEGLDVGSLAQGGGSFQDAPALRSILEGEQRRLVEEEIRQLPPQMRRSVTLYCSGLQHDDTAKILGVQTGTVKSLIAQAKARLTEVLRRKHPDLFAGGR